MKKKSNKPAKVTVVKGSHLTVTTHPDGSTVLEWDDAALLEDVRNATMTVPTLEVTKKRRKTKKTDA